MVAKTFVVCDKCLDVGHVTLATMHVVYDFPDIAKGVQTTADLCDNHIPRGGGICYREVTQLNLGV